jgi:hypothetical protein
MMKSWTEKHGAKSMPIYLGLVIHIFQLHIDGLAT